MSGARTAVRGQAGGLRAKKHARATTYQKRGEANGGKVHVAGRQRTHAGSRAFPTVPESMFMFGLGGFESRQRIPACAGVIAITQRGIAAAATAELLAGQPNSPPKHPLAKSSRGCNHTVVHPFGTLAKQIGTEACEYAKVQAI